MRDIIVTPISPAMGLGESPHWIEDEKVLLFVDHPTGNINKYYYETSRHQVVEIGNLSNEVGPSVVIPVEGHTDKFIVGLGHDLSVFTWKPSDSDISKLQPKSIAQFDLNYSTNSLNDAKCDSYGRLWAGTKGHEAKSGAIEPHLGGLYRINSNLKYEKCVEKVTLSNGMTWSLDNKLLYFIDSPELSIYVFDFDLANGKISNRKVFLNLKNLGITDEYPDGMTVDQNGNLWVALYNGGKVICIDAATAKIIDTIVIPSRYSTSCCFGGHDYSSLFVTSATRGLTDDEYKILPHSGKTFEIKGIGVKGSSHNCFKIDPHFLTGI